MGGDDIGGAGGRRLHGFRLSEPTEPGTDYLALLI